MTVAPPPVHPTPTGRHRAPADAPTAPYGHLPAGRVLTDIPTDHDSSPRGRGTHRAPGIPFARAARTAGLSLAAIGTLAAAGGVATGYLGVSDESTATGERSLPTQLATNDLTLDPAPAAASTASAAPAVMAVTASATPTAVASTTTVAPARSSTPTTRASAAAPRTPARTTSTSTSASPSRAAAAAVPAARSTTEQVSSTGSSIGARAVAAAKSRIGKPYVYGATGPNSFDCSGLVQWAYKQVGKSLPRTAAAQSQVGQKVSMSDLQPGDLIFFYSPVSHVVMYVGDGMVVEAPTAGQNVKLTALARIAKNAVGARRP